MSLLFDISLQDGNGQRKKPRSRPTATVEVEVEVKVVDDDALAAILSRPSVVIAKLDDHVECHRCLAMAMDVIEDYGREWQIECCFCGLKTTIPAIDGYLKPKGEGFVMNDGRFAGQTIEEIAERPRGMEYIEWASKEHERPTVRASCRKFLLTTQAASP